MTEDVVERNQKIFLSNVTAVVLADTLVKLNEYTDSLIEEHRLSRCGNGHAHAQLA